MISRLTICGRGRDGVLYQAEADLIVDDIKAGRWLAGKAIRSAKGEAGALDRSVRLKITSPLRKMQETL